MYTNIPSPLPDECLRGYGSRISAVNSQPINRLDKLLPSLAEITGLSIEHFIYHHTHLGYQRFVNGDFFQIDIGSHPDLLTNNRIYASACPADSYQFCPRCAEEDLDFHGVSYWRRAHLLPGVDHCSKHTVSLVIAKQMRPLRWQPAYAEVIRTAIPEDESAQYFSSAFIHRFTILSDLALQARIPFSPAVITRILVSRSNKLLGTERSILTKFVIEKFPASWLKRHFPLIFNKHSGARFSAVDEVLRSSRNAYRTKLYLLAMSVLWDDPDEAINACLQEATVHTSGFHESGAYLALKNVLMGESINKSCRRYGVHLRDFEFAFQKFLKDIRPVAHSYVTSLQMSSGELALSPRGRDVR